MTNEELLSRLNGVEWNDFEIKEAKMKFPKLHEKQSVHSLILMADGLYSV